MSSHYWLGVIASLMGCMFTLFILQATGRISMDREPDALYELANNKTELMLTGEGFFHNTEEYSIRAHDLGVSNVSENLYKGESCDIRTMIRLWNESPAHKANLDKGYNKAVLVVEREGGECYGTLEVQQ